MTQSRYRKDRRIQTVRRVLRAETARMTGETAEMFPNVPQAARDRAATVPQGGTEIRTDVPPAETGVRAARKEASATRDPAVRAHGPTEEIPAGMRSSLLLPE